MTADVASAEPHGVGELRAVRSFRLADDGRLYPIYSDQPWLPGDNRAVCNRGRDHAAPAAECHCGFYAYSDPRWAGEQPPAKQLLAVVELWGTLEVGTRGLRGSEARLAAIWLSPRSVDEELAARVRAQYPGVAIYRDRDRMLTEHPVTALPEYQRPRLAEATRATLRRLGVATAAAGWLLGCIPIHHLLAVPVLAALWLGVLAATVLTAAVAVIVQGASPVTAVSLMLTCWLLTGTAGPLAQVWLPRVPLILGALVVAALWRDLGQVGGEIPRADGPAAAVHRLAGRWPFRRS